MNIITLDFETYFDNDYTLSKMTTEAYVRDPRFEVHGCSVKMHPIEIPQWYPAPRLVGQKPSDRHGLFGAIDWSTTACLCHHAQFDGLILSHHYGIKPKMFSGHFVMARLLIGNHLSVVPQDRWPSISISEPRTSLMICSRASIGTS